MLGIDTVHLGIRKGTCEHEVVISARKRNLKCIIGSGFFSLYAITEEQVFPDS